MLALESQCLPEVLGDVSVPGMMPNCVRINKITTMLSVLYKSPELELDPLLGLDLSLIRDNQDNNNS